MFEGSVGEEEPFIHTPLCVLLSVGEDEVNMDRELMAVEDGPESQSNEEHYEGNLEGET